MKRRQFLKSTLLAGVAAPILAACGETKQPAANNGSAIATPTSNPTNITTTATVTTAVATTSAAVSSANLAAAPNNEPIVIHFNEFYASATAGADPILSQKLLGAKDKLIKITGYMAPPLKPALDFFVLTRIKMSTCPFCSTSADWPQDIVLVTMPPGKTFDQTEEPLTVVGRLEIGEAVDQQTGFFSLLRLRAQTVEIFQGE